MSTREDFQNGIAAWLVGAKIFNAPYGVIKGLRSTGRNSAKVRTITFGQARTLDAVLYIWSITNLVITWETSYGHLPHRGRKEFTNWEDAKKFLEENFK